MTVDTIVTTHQTIDGFGVPHQTDSTNQKTPVKKTLVVMDWTRSMYHYGTKLYEWHLHNLDKSTIEYLAFFNDGDQLPTELKNMGTTGGIYFNSTVDDITTVTELMDKVAKKGTGGDFPENYIEALIKSEQQFPDVDTVVLIADNRACIRDWQLIPQLQKKPIKIILCGIPPTRGVINYQFINLAAYTGGSVHVLGTEIKNLSMKNDNIFPEPPRDTTIIMEKRKGKIRDIRAEQAKLEKKYKSKSRPPVTIVNGNEYLLPRRSEITINNKNFVIGKASCSQYDFRRTPEVSVIPTFTTGQKIRIVLNKTLHIGVGIIILPVTLPLGLILGGPAGAAAAIPIQ